MVTYCWMLIILLYHGWIFHFLFFLHKLTSKETLRKIEILMLFGYKIGPKTLINPTNNGWLRRDVEQKAVRRFVAVLPKSIGRWSCPMKKLSRRFVAERNNRALVCRSKIGGWRSKNNKNFVCESSTGVVLIHTNFRRRSGWTMGRNC